MASHDATGRPAQEHANPLRKLPAWLRAALRDGVRGYYVEMLAFALARRRLFVIGFLLVVIVSFALVPMLGRNFFPAIDAGQIDMHVRAPVGTRHRGDRGRVRPCRGRRSGAGSRPTRLATIVDNIGLPVSGINLAYSNSGSIGPQDGDILITLARGPSSRPRAMSRSAARSRCPGRFPGSTFSFLPADIISQILNFGAPAPIDVQISTVPTAKGAKAYAHANSSTRMRLIAGIADVRLQQATDYPELRLRRRSQPADAARHHRERRDAQPGDQSRGQLRRWRPPSGSIPSNGVVLSDRRPDPAISHRHAVDDMNNLPVTGGQRTASTRSSARSARLHRTNHRRRSISHYAVKPVLSDVYATTQGRDLGAVSGEIDRAIKATRARLAQGQPPSRCAARCRR